MAQQTQYAYADSSFRRIVISEEELHQRGTYSGTAAYVSRDAINYGNSLYIALISVSGTAPEGNHSDFWSALSVINQGNPDPFAQLEAEIGAAQNTADSALSGANFAITLAGIGTNVGSNAYALAQAAFDYAIQGTSAAQALAVAQAGTQRAEEAYYLAMQGTNGANFGILLATYGTNGVEQLYPIAASGTSGANAAFQLASLGTFLAGDAIRMIGTLSPVDQGARDIAQQGTEGVHQVYPIANAGTAGVNQVYPIANAGTAGVNQVYPIALAGTSGVNQVYPIATSGTAGANQAFFLATQGTNGANFGILLAGIGTDAAAYALGQALFAIQLASAGTTGADTAGTLAFTAYLLAISGTNGIAQVYPIANSGTAGVNQVFPIAVAGTNTANAGYAIATSGTSGANAAYGIATSGTSGANAAYALATTGTNLAGYILSIVGTTLGIAGTGTLALYLSQLPLSDRADMRMNIQNGVITSFGSSLYSIENFQNYSVGVIGNTLGDLGFMSAWFGTASINGWRVPQNSALAYVSVDQMQYTAGTVTTPGTLTGGTIWSNAWQSGSFAYNLAQDPLTSYTTGTAIAGQINGGTNWFGVGAFL